MSASKSNVGDAVELLTRAKKRLLTQKQLNTTHEVDPHLNWRIDLVVDDLSAKIRGLKNLELHLQAVHMSQDELNAKMIELRAERKDEDGTMAADTWEHYNVLENEYLRRIRQVRK